MTSVHVRTAGALLATGLLLTLATSSVARDRQQTFLRLFPDASILAEAPLPIRNYYPLNVGRSWTYVDSISGEQFTLRVTEHTAHGATPVARVKDLSKPNTYDLVTLAGPLKLVFRNDENGALDWSAEPVPFSQGDTVTLGDKYSATPSSYTNPVTGGHFNWSVTVKKVEDVTVPAGTFQGCIRMDVTTLDTASGAQVANFKMWIAPGVGLVRRTGRFISRTFKQELLGHTN